MSPLGKPSRILIVDDDRAFCRMLADLVERTGVESHVCHRLDDCRRELTSGHWDLVLLDVGLPDGSGLDLVPWIRELPQSPEVVIITGAGDADGAELAVTSGAWDYLLKTSAFERVNLAVTRALEHRATARQLKAIKSLNREGIVGKSPKLRHCLDLVAQAALTDFNILITGETGTGKELFARAIHANSARAVGRLVVVDCAALPETLVESVLFGHVKGAFTGADQGSDGLFKAADGGTLFLDEVGELPLNLQKTFLRVLHERTFRPVGSKEEVSSNFRLVAATNRDLDQDVLRQRFRKDLLFRLRTMTIELPPLSERLEDLTDLVHHHLARLNRMRHMEDKPVSDEFLEAMGAYQWPGNIRELEHVLEAAFSAAIHDPVMLVQHLPPQLRVAWTRRHVEHSAVQPSAPSAPEVSPEPEGLPSIRKYRQNMEAQYLHQLMSRARGDVRCAADMAGLSLSRLYGMLREHGLRN